MRWKARPLKPREERNPWKAWVCLQWFLDMNMPGMLPDILGRFYPHRCHACSNIVVLESMYYRRIDEENLEWKCGVCMTLDELAGKEKL